MDMAGEGGTDMVTVSVSETYDLSTKPNKMSLIAVHTPGISFLRRLYPGFFINYKKCKFEYADVTIACASVLPADPLQIGTEAGSIAPSDLMNPILYKAVSNESLSTLEYRIQTLGTRFEGEEFKNLQGQSAIITRENATTLTDEFPVYYGLLSNRDGWRVAMPQQGLTMSRLIPLCFDRYYNYGGNPRVWPVGATAPNQYPGIKDDGTVTGSNQVYSIAGKARPLPAFDTTVLNATSVAPGTSGDTIAGDPIIGGTAVPGVGQSSSPVIPPFYVAAIVMPPSKLQTLYYRMVIRWYISFSGPRQIEEVTDYPYGLQALGNLSYFTDYNFGTTLSTKAVSDTNMVSVADADIQKVMEGS